MQNGLRHCLNNVPQRMRSGAKAVIIELQMVILLQQKISFQQRKMQPDKVFKGLGIDECVTRAVSLFSEREEAEKRLKLPKFKKANIALVILEPKDGVLKKTFDIAHYSWWRTKDFNVLQAKIV